MLIRTFAVSFAEIASNILFSELFLSLAEDHAVLSALLSG